MTGALVLLRLNRVILDVPLGSDPSLGGLTGLLFIGCGMGGLVIGGLFSSTFLTLIVVPTLYVTLYRVKEPAKEAA